MAFNMVEKHSSAYSVTWGINDIIYTEKRLLIRRSGRINSRHHPISGVNY